MRRRILQIAVSAALLVAGCGDSSSGVPAVTNAAPPPTPATAAPKPAQPPETSDAGLLVTGPLIVEHQVDVMAQRDGVLAKIFYDAPARIKAGTVIARMDDQQIAANLEAARAKSRSIAADLKNWEAEAQVLKADYGRAQKLWAAGLISEEQLEHAKYKAESDQWDIKRVTETLNTAHEEERSLELELAKTEITAPFDGLIARRYVREGQSVSKGERLFWVTAEAPLLMRFTLPEKYFGRVRAAQQFEITSPDVPGERHTAQVKEISPVVDPASGTFEVLVELTGRRGSLRPGMTASLPIENPR
ncbi:MAG: efflux RND transporter periplasmic adaptor subunit [Candidatus Acidiferrales bacterium]